PKPSLGFQLWNLSTRILFTKFNLHTRLYHQHRYNSIRWSAPNHVDIPVAMMAAIDHAGAAPQGTTETLTDIADVTVTTTVEAILDLAPALALVTDINAPGVLILQLPSSHFPSTRRPSPSMIMQSMRSSLRPIWQYRKT